MNKKIIFTLIAVAVAISAFSLIQNNRIRQLKKIQNSYEALTKNFIALQNNYEETLDRYNLIKQELDKSNHNLDSLRIQLDSLNQENRSLLDSLSIEINTIINSVDTVGKEFEFFDWRIGSNDPKKP